MSPEIITTIIMGVLTAIIGTLGWYFKRNLDHLDEKDRNHQTQIDTLKEDLSKYKLAAMDKFVTKDEFIRAVSRHDKKLDQIYDEVMKLNRKDGSNGYRG